MISAKKKNSNIDALINRGKNEDFLLESEITDTLSSSGFSSIQIEQAIEQIKNSGVTIVSPEQDKEIDFEREGVEDALSEYLYAIRGIPLLTEEEEYECGKIIAESKDKQAVEKAKHRLVEGNLRLVVIIASHYKYRMPFLDLIQEGNIGLIKAVDKYDYTYPNKLSTYASFWIKQSIRRALDDQSRAVRVPTYLMDDYRLIKNLQQKYILTNCGSMTDAEINAAIAAELGKSVQQIQEILNSVQDTVSLDVPINKEEGSTLGDLIEDQTIIAVDTQVILNEISHKTREMLSCLDDRELYIISHRYGLTASRSIKTLSAIGEDLGITRERVRQIEAKAINKLRRSSNAIPVRDLLVND